MKSITLWSCLSATTVLVSLSPGSLAVPVQATGPDCVTKGIGGPWQITADCIDPMYNSAILDKQTEETSPVPHRKVSGHFNGTNVDFNIYLPKQGWDGRFFQLVYPLQNSSADSREIGFGADSGGYTVRVAGGVGYRADAAVSKLSKAIARDYYRSPRRQISGYVYGGSGGSLTTIGAIENTFGVWDGAVALIQAVPVSNPNNFAIRAFGGLLLEGAKDKLIDAVRPGGSGDPTKFLNAVQRAAWEEVTELGIPVKAWEDFEGVGQDRTNLWNSLRTLVTPIIKAQDPTYGEDFWTKPGYLGTERSALGNFFRKALFEYDATVQQVNVGPDNVPTQITLDTVPGTPPHHGLEFTIRSSDGKGSLGSFTARLDKASKTASIFAENNATLLATLTKGTKLSVSNRFNLAVHSYHRHQVPTRSGFYGYDYLRTASGEPKYPQRDVLIAPSLTRSASGGGTHTGNFSGKVMVMDNLKDFDAFPWHADWYKSEVQKSLGDRFEDNYRLYYSDNADHFMGPVLKPQNTRVVDFTNLYEQHLRDLSAWVEKGRAPPKPTKYTVNGGQVSVPRTAAQRLGIQPVVELTAKNSARVHVKVGASVTLKAHIEVPPNTGSVVAVEWDFDGVGDFAKMDFGTARGTMDVKVKHAYQMAGTYYPAVRVYTHRKGGTKSPYATPVNLGRMRVIVS
ncbi:hypothetical protein EDB80DRAFT_745760 [Ilyonectria destructans]|nr:hypothetical protein EDB80DRAFT_745760 [Ilyonectria destructans]